MEIQRTILECLGDVGIDLVCEPDIDVDLRECFSDSIVFISFVIELEKKLDIELPYEVLLLDNLSSLKGFCNMIEALCNNGN